MTEAIVRDTAVVERGLEDQVATEALLALRAKKDARLRAFDPRLGATREEAEASLERIRSDLGAYGEFVHGHTPARHHRLWIDLIHGLVSGTLTDVAIEKGLLPEAARGTFRNKLLLLAPPASAKSAWCSLALPTWYLGNHPDHNVLFFTSSDPAANGFGNTIKILLEQAKEHREVFPDRLTRPHKTRGWSGDGLYLHGTPMSGQSPAYRAVGWGASVMGNRADLLIIDDPMNQENAESPIEQPKAKKYFDMTLAPRLKPGSGAALAVMTRWAEGDLASHFIEKANAAGDWLVVALPMVAEADDPMGRQPGEVLWPEQFPERFVTMMRQGMLAAQWACVYQCSASQMAGDVFSDERWFKPLPPDFSTIRPSLLVIQGVDVAFSEKDRACFTVILTLGLNTATGEAYILGVHRDRMTVGQTEDAIVSQILHWQPAIIGIEDTAFKHAVTAELVSNVRRRVYANIVAVPPREMVKGRSDKVARARLPAQRAEAGLLYADKQAHWWPAFINECFPGETRIRAEDVLGANERLYTGDLVVLETQNGVIETTPNHPFWTDRGWCPAGMLWETSRILYIYDHANKTAIHEGPIGRVARSVLNDEHPGCREDLRDISTYRSVVPERVLRWLQQDVRLYLSNQAGDGNADRACVHSGLGRWRGDYLNHAYGATEPDEGDGVDRQYARAADGLACRTCWGNEEWSLGTTPTRVSRARPVFPVPIDRPDPGRLVRGALTLSGHQATAYGVGDRVLPPPSSTDAQGAEATTCPGNRAGDPGAEYQAIKTIGRRAVRDLKVYNLSTRSMTYLAGGYLVHNCLAFPRGKTNDQVDALSLAMYMPLRLRVADHRPRALSFNPH